MLWYPPPIGSPNFPLSVGTERIVAPEPAPRGMAATSIMGYFIPHSLATWSIPLVCPEPPTSRISIFPFTVGSVALNARTIAADTSLSVRTSISDCSILALIELWIALSATPISVQY